MAWMLLWFVLSLPKISSICFVLISWSRCYMPSVLFCSSANSWFVSPGWSLFCTSLLILARYLFHQNTSLDNLTVLARQLVYDDSVDAFHCCYSFISPLTPLSERHIYFMFVLRTMQAFGFSQEESEIICMLLSIWILTPLQLLRIQLLHGGSLRGLF